MSQIEIYEKSNLHLLRWPKTAEGQWAKDYLTPLIMNGVEKYISNIKTDLKILAIDDIVLPITINDKEYGNCFTCSPYTHYIAYAFEELHLIKNHFLRIFLKGLLHILGAMLRFGRFNRVITINNWMMSTNLYPPISENQLKAITAYLKEQYPGHAITLRSLHPRMPLFATTKNCGYRALFSRQIYFLDPKEQNPYQSRPFKQDLDLMKKGAYSVLDTLEAKDAPRARELYKQLFLDKYSLYNPQFTNAFFALIIERSLFHLKGLQKEGKIDGIVGYYTINGSMIAPIFGYQTDLKQETGLYRMLSALVVLDALKYDRFLNESSGAGAFKKMRKAKSSIEYIAFYVNHLPLRQRLPWLTLQSIVNTLGERVVKAYEL